MNSPNDDGNKMSSETSNEDVNINKLVDDEEKPVPGKKYAKDFTFGRIIGEGAFGAVSFFFFCPQSTQ